MNTRIEKITNILDANKAEAIEVFDLSEKNYFVDFAIIASSLGSFDWPVTISPGRVIKDNSL